VAVDDTVREDAGPEVPVGLPVEHRGTWSEADYRALGEKALGDGRVELIDGALLVGPGPTEDDERTVARTRAALEEALPDGLCVVGPVALRMGPDCVLVPDLLVMRAPATGETDADAEDDAENDADDEAENDAEPDTDPASDPDAVIDAAEVLLVAEIVGPEHGAVERVFKPLLYARARLPYLLIVDHQAPFAAASMVIGGRYHEYARASGSDELELEEPFRLRLRPREK
jgi:putative restriction endonuclease